MPPNGEAMFRMLLRDPFWVAPSEARKLTDREMWEWYILPQLERQEAEKGERDGPRERRRVIRDDDPAGMVRGGDGRPVNPEVALMMLASAGLGDPKQAAETIRQRREAKGR